MWFACKKYHPTYGVPGTGIKGMPLPKQIIELGRGWEWWPSVAWQFIWAWIVSYSRATDKSNYQLTYGLSYRSRRFLFGELGESVTQWDGARRPSPVVFAVFMRLRCS